MIDRYYEPDWVAAHPEIQDLWHRLIHSPNFQLNAKQAGTYYRIDKGIAGSERRMLFTCSPLLENRLGSTEAPFWLASDDLSDIVEQAKQSRGLDLVAIFKGATE